MSGIVRLCRERGYGVLRRRGRVFGGGGRQAIGYFTFDSVGFFFFELFLLVFHGAFFFCCLRLSSCAGGGTYIGRRLGNAAGFFAGVE
jgi:hypothetical protein